MPAIELEFHALPEEVLPLVVAFVDDASAYVAAIHFPPYRAFAVDRASLEETFLDPSVRDLAFTTSVPSLPLVGTKQFLDQNPGALSLDIGRRDEGGLRESWLTARTDDQADLAVWRKLAARVRKITRTGATVVNPATGATARARNHRFSVGAKALARDGIPMLTIVGLSGNRYRFED